MWEEYGEMKVVTTNGIGTLCMIDDSNWALVISDEGTERGSGIFDIEDEIFNICRTFSLESKNQQKNLIETIKQNCRRIVREKTGKKPYTRINLARI